MIKDRYYITAGTRPFPFLKYPVGTDLGTKVAAFAAAFIDDELH
jgi:hypothetical protein